jgi:hypothetical protein
MSNEKFEVCERVTGVQALLHDHVECGKRTAGEVVERPQAVLSESAVLLAMYDVGYFPQNTPPDRSAAVTVEREEVVRSWL